MTQTAGLQFSIIVPCYNSERTIAEAVDSACRQTVRDIEIIIVNDGSTDNSPDIIARLAEADERIRIVSQVNGGLSAARNAGIAVARAPILVFLDGDDRLMPEFLAAHVENFASDPRIGLSFGRARFMDWHGRPLTQQTKIPMRDVKPRDLLIKNPVTACFAARRELIAEAGLFDTDLKRVEDAEWLFRAALTSWRLAGIDKVLYDYRTSPGGLSSDLEAMLKGYEAFLDSARRRAPELVAEVGAESRARMLLYLERRAIAFGRPRSVIGRFAWAAFTACPGLVLRDPARVGAMLMAGLVPGVAGLIAPRCANA